MVFRFYDAPTGGTLLGTNTHTAGNGNAITVTNGHFSAVLGTGTGNSLAGIDFSTTPIYIGLTINGDSEMTPREELTSVPYAFDSDTLDGYDSTELLRYNATGSMTASDDDGPLLTLNQTGTGSIIELFTGATNRFSVLNNGYVGIGTSTPGFNLTVSGDTMIGGALYDNTASAGTSGFVLQSTGSGLAWVATSSLGITGGGGGGGSLFTDGGDTTYLTSLTDNLAVGTTESATAWQGLDYEGSTNLTGSIGLDAFDAVFSTDGTLLFISVSGGLIHEYELSVPFDHMTATATGVTFSTLSQGSGQNLHFSTDGLKMFIMVGLTDTIYAYDLSTAFDISTAVYNGESFNVTLQDSTATSLTFSPDGLKLFIVGSATDRVHAYDLSVAYDLSTALYGGENVLVSGQTNTPSDVTFTNDGLRMVVIHSFTGVMYQYNLSTAFDLTTAVYSTISYTAPERVVSINYNAASDTILAYIDFIDSIAVFPLGVPGEINSIATAQYLPTGVMFAYLDDVLINNDGTRVFLLDSNMDTIQTFSLSVPYDLTTAVLDPSQFYVMPTALNNPERFTFSQDGNWLYVRSGGTVYEFTLAVPFDVSTANPTGNSLAGVFSVDFLVNDDGTEFYVRSGTAIQIYSLTVPYDLSTATNTGVSVSVLGVDILFNDTGTALYTADGFSLYRYNLSVPYDVSSAVYSGETQRLTSGRIADISSDGTRVYTFAPFDGTRVYTLYTYSYNPTSVSSRLTIANGVLNILGINTALTFNAKPFLFALSTTTVLALGAEAGSGISGNAHNLTLLGTRAGQLLSGTNEYHILAGYEAGANLGFDATSSVIAIGTQAGYVANGSDNILVGTQAGYATAGVHNILMGYRAGTDNTGSFNVAVGYEAGVANSGIENVLLGTGAGAFNTGNFNVLVGSSTGANNIGDYNIYLSPQAGENNTGSYNVASGQLAGQNNTGSDNVFLGRYTGSINTGDDNVLVGYESARYLSGTSNTFVGAFTFSGTAPFTAINNVAVGYRAGFSAETGANNNILVGYQAADNLTTGANNIVIGYDVDLQDPTQSNTLNIGNLIFGTGITGTGSTISPGNIGIGVTAPTAQLHTTGSVRFATFGAGTLQTDASGNLSVSSDERLKDIHAAFTDGLDAVLNIEPIVFNWNEASGFDQSTEYIGFSAQNIKSVLPQAVGENADGLLSLSDRGILAAVVNAVREVYGMIIGNQARVAEAQERVRSLQAAATAADAALVQYNQQITQLEAMLTEQRGASAPPAPPAPDESVATTTDVTDVAAAADPLVVDQSTASTSPETTDLDMSQNTENAEVPTDETSAAEADSPAEPPVDIEITNDTEITNTANQNEDSVETSDTPDDPVVVEIDTATDPV